MDRTVEMEARVRAIDANLAKRNEGDLVVIAGKVRGRIIDRMTKVNLAFTPATDFMRFVESRVNAHIELKDLIANGLNQSRGRQRLSRGIA